MSADSSPEDKSKLCHKNSFVYRGITWDNFTSLELLQRSEKFRFLSDDIVVATYPRSGTSLTQEIVWHIVNHEIVKKDEQYGSLDTRFPFLEFNKDFTERRNQYPIDVLESQTSKRLIKTHLPYFFIRDQFEKVNPKMIVVMRNPKDTIISCYNFCRGLRLLDNNATFDDYLQTHFTEKALGGDVRSHNRDYWALRDRLNVLIIRYEDIIYQPFQQVRTIASFLGYTLSEETIAVIVHNTAFETMQKNVKVNWTLPSGSDQFLRKGKCGDWKNWLTVAKNEVMDVWIEEKLSGAGLHFTYD